ncbi:MAG TPA: glycoside hydrolase family 3 N-terminal domain-containing protein, partial [Methylomirabilota bacterium]|nr:glycoside hydrolase family 3 N-terminal domain-containing protein [Methylomirabilota bacterium]
MKGRIAGVFLLPLLFLMAIHPRGLGRPKAQTNRTAQSRKTQRKTHSLPPEAEKWVEATMRRMTLDEKVGQLIFPKYHGSLTAKDTAAYAEITHDVEKLHVGGFINATLSSPLGIVKSQAYPTAILNNQLQSKAKIPLLIGADFERGTAMRLDEGTSFPTAMAVAAAGRPADAYTMGRITALESRAVGVQWIYAPDADVNNNPANPIINTRSFGEDPASVSGFVTQFIRGVEENGALATAKHFPGHGDTSTDSHLDLPVIHADRRTLETVELAPFRAAIAAGVSSVMPGHLYVPSLEPEPDTPATLSPAILTGLLRKQLGFDGLIVTDAMDMAALTSHFTPGEAAVRAVLAGADCLLQPALPDAAFEGVREAVLRGRIPRARLDESVRRLLRAKARLGLHKNRLVDVDALSTRFATASFANAAQEISDRGITLLRDSAHKLPLDATKPARALLLAVSADPEPYPAEDLERELRGRFDWVTAVRADTKFVSAASARLPAPETYDLAIVAIFVRVSDRKGNIDVPGDQAALIQQVFSAGKPVVCIGFGSPYLIEKFPQAQTWLAAFGISDVAQISAARALFGQIPIAGNLPVSIPGANLKRGDGLRVPASSMSLAPMDSFAAQRLQPAFDAVAHGVESKAFPG